MQSVAEAKPSTATSPSRRLTLSVLIPCYNELPTIEKMLEKVEAVGLADEIIVVDDGSTDGTRELLRQLEAEGRYNARYIYHERNQGKGAALVTAFKHATSEVFLIQDADLEYNPEDYPSLLKPIEQGITKVVYGSRFLGAPRRTMYFWNMVANKVLTLATNILYNTILSDMETCYKVFSSDVVSGMKIRARGFEFEPEFTAKVLKQGIHIYEVPITFVPRPWEEGKKIKWTDGPIALWTLVKYRFVD